MTSRSGKEDFETSERINVHNTIEHLRDQLNLLHDRVELLRNSIKPILSPDDSPSETVPADDDPVTCDLANVLHGYALELERINYVIIRTAESIGL